LDRRKINLPAPKEIIDLIEQFDRNIERYKSGSYNEEDVRSEFIDPFFKALGWDLYNEMRYSEDYKDVVRERSLRMEEGGTKAPDYSFRIGGTPKFFVEAKKPSVNLKGDISPAFQLRRYGWSAKLPLSVLTDFEELAVYDCRIKPVKTDKSSTARVFYYDYKEYIEKWDEIASIFSKESVLRGSFDKYAQDNKAKRGTAEVDAAFLEEISKWRKDFAQNIALRNKDLDLTIRDLNYAVQVIIDRIVFLRICEDRGIERYGQLQALISGEGVYRRLRELFRRADERYNSGLFHFEEESGREDPDNLTLKLEIDDKILKEVIKGLYYPDSPYAFKFLPSEILGQVYEQFLGKIIRLTEGHQAKVEDKPEVKKAGGVFYTPTFVVDYNVLNTVGRVLEGKTPAQASDLRILDPACGSGSFLLGAYKYLLEWHSDWYAKHLAPLLDAGEPATSPKVKRLLPPSRDFEEHNGKGRNSARGKRNDQDLPLSRAAGTDQKSGFDWKLTTAEKKRILLNNIYGVDIDPQAVEVTKLSLLLKVLEGENRESMEAQQKLIQERVLPDLINNIKCGNSLIGPEFFDGRTTFDMEERLKLNAFDWESEFPGGKFDVVIGNPPYVRQEALGEFKDYFKMHYQVYHGVADLYSYFIERGVSLLKDGGIFSYIVANKWMRANYGEPLRRWLKEQCIEEIIDFGDLPVFKTATTYPCIIRITNKQPNDGFKVTQVKTLEFTSLSNYVKDHQYNVSRSTLDDNGWSLDDEKTSALLAKIKAKGVPLKEYVGGKIYRGVLTGLNEAFVIDKTTRERLIAEDAKSEELIKPFLAGRDIKRYQTRAFEKYLIFTRHGVNIKDYPAIERHLHQYK
jgi:type I restriction-modification system DNA methylase subunit